MKRETIRSSDALRKQDAIVSDPDRRQRLQRLADQFGTFDEFLTLEELRRMREDG
jgi:hypothetical protein